MTRNELARPVVVHYQQVDTAAALRMWGGAEENQSPVSSPLVGRSIDRHVREKGSREANKDSIVVARVSRSQSAVAAAASCELAPPVPSLAFSPVRHFTALRLPDRSRAEQGSALNKQRRVDEVGFGLEPTRSQESGEEGTCATRPAPARADVSAGCWSAYDCLPVRCWMRVVHPAQLVYLSTFLAVNKLLERRSVATRRTCVTSPARRGRADEPPCPPTDRDWAR
jgi:hypothetical protein